MATFTITASKYNGQPQHVYLNADTETLEAAQELAASFPKSYRVKAGEVSSYREGRSWGCVQLRVDMRETEDNTVNETGIKRYRAFVRKAEQAGHAVKFTEQERANHVIDHWFMSREELEAALDAQLAGK